MSVLPDEPSLADWEAWLNRIAAEPELQEQGLPIDMTEPPVESANQPSTLEAQKYQGCSPQTTDTQELSSEIGHVLSEPSPSTSIAHSTIPTTPAVIDMLSQAMAANDSASVQALIQNIEQNHSHAETIEILLAATLNLCRSA
ncbi:MAG: hypothetical protein NZL92_03435 [Gloeomargarita sp. SKYG116]|nr:hypothetical protein [Gloeomargarita sp. SKYG116]MDW8400735.1 hypothetical protein [Gloeomargarita sp. SKYGB_i_bin116]